MTSSQALFEVAQKVIPGGVNSPVRAFSAVGGAPRFIRSAKGARIIDEDGISYIDYVGSWGPLLLGHAHSDVLRAVFDAAADGLSFGAATRGEAELAARICSMVPSVQLVRLTSSGTEAVMSAVRLARGYTGRDKIIKFEGCYHGHSDAMLVKAGSGVLTAGVAGSAGVTGSTAGDTLVAQFNGLESVTGLFRRNPGQVAAVITELVPANMGVVVPKDGFLQELQTLCNKNGALFIADEVITGFRLGPGGAQEKYGLSPDLTAFGKVIGGGMPVGAFGGRGDIMRRVAPCGDVYQAGTLSGNPVAVAAGNAQLRILKEQPEIYAHVDAMTCRLAAGLRESIEKRGFNACVNNVGSLFTLFFTKGPVLDYMGVKACDTAAFARYFNSMLSGGIYLAPSQFEAGFVSLAHTPKDIDETLMTAAAALGNAFDE